MSAYLNALREEGTREDLLRELERQYAEVQELKRVLADLHEHLILCVGMAYSARHNVKPAESGSCPLPS